MNCKQESLGVKNLFQFKEYQHELSSTWGSTRMLNLHSCLASRVVSWGSGSYFSYTGKAAAGTSTAVAISTATTTTADAGVLAKCDQGTALVFYYLHAERMHSSMISVRVCTRIQA